MNMQMREATVTQAHSPMDRSPNASPALTMHVPAERFSELRLSDHGSQSPAARAHYQPPKNID